MKDLDRIIHEPVRLRVLMALSGIESADYQFLQTALGLTSGNLSSHLDKLQSAGYIEIQKTFCGRTPNTECRMTAAGTQALAEYWREIDEIRGLAGR